MATVRRNVMTSRFTSKPEQKTGGRKPGAVPLLDLIESWGFVVEDMAVIEAIQNLLDAVQRDECNLSRDAFGVFVFMARRRREGARHRAEEDSQRRAARSGREVVYFIQGADVVKIGYTSDLSARLAGMSQHRGAVMATVSGGRAKERELHERFSHLRIGRTEWFSLAPELAEFIAATQSQVVA